MDIERWLRTALRMQVGPPTTQPLVGGGKGASFQM
jgi:hypothetical protein